MEASIKWDVESIMLLIALIRERPVIWDYTCLEHKSKTKKTDAFSEVAEIMGTNEHSVISKWFSLRSQYNRERKKITGSKSGAEQVYRSKWFAYEEMGSLMSNDMAENTQYESNTASSQNTPATSMSPSVSSPSPATPSPPVSPPPKRRRPGTELVEVMNFKAIKDQSRNEGDEVTAFGTYVSAQLRTLHPILQSKLKLDIQTLLSKYEIQNIEFGRSGVSETDYFFEAVPSPSSSTYLHQDIKPTIRVRSHLYPSTEVILPTFPSTSTP